MQNTLTSNKASASFSAGAVILAAGSSRRMEGVDKTFAPLLGKPLLQHTLGAFLACSSVSNIVLVLSRANLERGRSFIEQSSYEKVTLCLGGARRQDSARAGLEAMPRCDFVAVHDAARACVDVDLIERGLACAREHGSAVAAVPVVDTIKLADRDRVIEKTLDRNLLWAAQTPQIFRYEDLRKAYESSSEDGTDDASLMERIGVQVKLFTGSYDNIKVTTPIDLVLAEHILRGRKGNPCA